MKKEKSREFNMGSGNSEKKLEKRSRTRSFQSLEHTENTEKTKKLFVFYGIAT